jgi:hypothetical protein
MGGKVACYQAKPGFAALLKRLDGKVGVADYLFSELAGVYLQVKIAMDDCRYVRVVKQIQSHCSRLGKVCQTAL